MQNSTKPEAILEELPSKVFYSKEVNRALEPASQQINDGTIDKVAENIVQIDKTLDKQCSNGVLKVLPKLDNNKAINCNGNVQNGNIQCIEFSSSSILNLVDDVDSGKEDSDDDNHDDFFNEIFNCTRPKYISVPTDTFPCSDDSDSESSTADVEVKFYIDKSRSKPVAEYGDTEYRIGFLDLTSDEHSCIGMMIQTTVDLSFDPKHIVIRDGTLNIRRINERQFYSPPSSQCVELFESLNLVRVQFSSTERFLAKYEDEIYLVGEKLYEEYTNLLHRTKKPTGTSIRIRNDRLTIDFATQTLDVHQTISFRNQNEICVISGTPDCNNYLDDYPSNGFYRVVLGHNPFEILVVEPKLIHSSIYDDCTEIYAEQDFPFAESERVQKIVKNTAKAERQRKVEFIDPENE